MRLLAIQLLLLAIGVAAKSHQARLLLAKDIPGGGLTGSGGEAQKCLNTAQGWHYLADSRGMVCTRDGMDYSSGCCKQGEKFACDKCKLTDKCCAEYEHCVSCCLAPQHDAEKLFGRTLRAPKNPAAGIWPSAWEYCRGVCRTHSSSTAHENAYISSRHHCFSTLGRPMLTDPLPADALAGVSAAMSAAGESCDDACAKRNEACSAPHLTHLNSCDRLRELVGCEAGCDAIKLPGGGCPGYVDSGAPKPARPAMCFTQPADAVGALGCGGKDANVRRLCACKPKTK